MHFTKIFLILTIFLLLSCSFCTNDPDHNSRTLKEVPASYLLYQGFTKLNPILIKKAVIKGADINQRNEVGFTPLMLVAQGGFGSSERHASIIHTLVKLGADVDIGYKGSAIGSHKGMTALMMASKNAQYLIVEALLDESAPTDSIDEVGYAAIHWATGPCNREEKGIFENSRRPNIACTKVVEMLIKAGAELSPESNPMKPIDLAANNQNWETVGVLLDAGVKTTNENLIVTARRLPGRDKDSWPDSYLKPDEKESPVIIDDDPLMQKDYLKVDPPLE